MKRTSIKRFLLQLAVLLTFVACSNKQENKVLLDQIENDNFALRASKIETKVNGFGLAQCSKYARVENDENNFLLYGYNVLNTILWSTSTVKKNVSNQLHDSLKNHYLEIQITPNTSEVEYKSIVKNWLERYYNIEISSKQVVVNGYKISLLKPKQSNNIESTVTVSDGELNIQNYNLQNLCTLLNEWYPVHFVAENNKEGKIDCKLPLKIKEENLINTLRASGISAEPKQITVTEISVFHKHK